MQVRSIAMLLRWLYPCQNGLVVAVFHAVEKTFLVAQPIQLIALTTSSTCWTPLAKKHL